MTHTTAPGLNGQQAAPRPRPAPRRGKAKPPAARPSRRILGHARRLAAVVGGIGVGVLGLSVCHCTEAIGTLTGSHWALSGLLAIGIDAGLVAAELVELAAYQAQADDRLCWWARGYTAAAVLLSVLLNAYAFGMHAPAGMLWAAWLLGAVIPGLVLALGRMAGRLYLAAE